MPHLARDVVVVPAQQANHVRVAAVRQHLPRVHQRRHEGTELTLGGTRSASFDVSVRKCACVRVYMHVHVCGYVRVGACQCVSVFVCYGLCTCTFIWKLPSQAPLMPDSPVEP